MRQLVIIPFFLFYHLSLAAGPASDLFSACMQTNNERIHSYNTLQLVAGQDISSVSKPDTVSAKADLLLETCDWPDVRVIHCHLRQHGGGMLPSSALPDGIRGDIKFLVYHENLCRERRAQLGLRNPIVHGVLLVPDNVLTLYQLGPVLRTTTQSRPYARSSRSQPSASAYRQQPSHHAPDVLPHQVATRLFDRTVEAYKEQNTGVRDLIPERIFWDSRDLFGVRTVWLR